ncbi:CRISPR-associated endoribonuclease Cas2 [Candidatus Electrothrix laxa]
MKRRAMVIAYDITDNKRRRKLFRVLKSWKLSAQYSVFECKLTRAEASELFLQLTDLLDEEQDILLLARLDGSRKFRGLTQCSGIGFKVPILYMG